MTVQARGDLPERVILDAETVEDEPPTVGAPVDPPVEPRTIYATLEAYSTARRRPIVPAWLRSRRDAAMVSRWALRTIAYAALYHATRAPKYAAKAAVWTPVGAARLTWRAIGWAVDTEQWSARQAAAKRNDIDGYMKLVKEADHHRHVRVPLLIGVLVALMIAVLLTVFLAPWWLQFTLATTTVVVLARVGRPPDRPILDRVENGPRYVRLTAELVRGALCSLGISGIKDPGALKFPVEIHRDGPGHLARVNLPQGVEAVEVLERRGRLSSALRLPVDQVWPTAGPDHAGQVDLWVGFQPASKMGQPRWSLAADNARTSVFDEIEFGTDERQRPVKTTLFARNFLIGGVPGSGKSYGARTLALAAALDPTVELKIAEFKGTADFGDLAPLCSTYVCGVDDQALAEGGAIIEWGLAEAERRGKRIRAARERGEAPEGKVTPELAARPGSGLHPVVIILDEAHEVLVDKEVAAAAERLIKRGRALALIVVLATQVPDARSVPPNITRCVTIRWCMAVQDQVANDMILGTGAYKRGITATAYRPGRDAGWGMVIGLPEPTAVRSHYPTPETTAKILARATVLRGGAIVGDTDEPAAPRDVLGDVIRVWAERLDRQPGAHWQQLAALLADYRPDTYASITAESVSALLRGAGVPSVDVKIRGEVLKGCRLVEVRTALQSRTIGTGSGTVVSLPNRFSGVFDGDE